MDAEATPPATAEPASSPPKDDAPTPRPILPPPHKTRDPSSEWMTHVEIPARPRPLEVTNHNQHQHPAARTTDREKKLSEKIKNADRLRAEREAKEQIDAAQKRGHTGTRAAEKRQRRRELPTPVAKDTRNEERRQANPDKPTKKMDQKTNLNERLKKAINDSRTDADELKSLAKLLPRPIRLSWKDKPFNILQFTRDVEVTGMSLSQLLALSPALRRVLGDSLKTLPSKDQNVLLAKYPGLGIDSRDPEICAYLARSDLARNTTHHFLATVNGHPTKPYLDGGACVNVCSPDFLKRANITKVSNISKISVRSLGGLMPAMGEASMIPLDIAGQTVIIGCIIMNNVPFELLLGRGFLEMTKCITDWDSGLYDIKLGGKTIRIDGGAGSAPAIIKEEDTTIEIQPRLKRGYQGLIDSSSETETEPSHDDDDASTEDAYDDSSLPDEDESSDTDDDEYADAFLAALRDISDQHPQIATVEEILEDERTGQIENVYILMAVPKEYDEDNALPAVFCLEQDVAAELSTVKYTNDQYGFRLETARSRDVLSDTPCRLIPGLEDRHIQVGDVPEVEELLDEIKQLFEKHAGAFPKDGEMSRTMREDRLSAPASFHIRTDMPLPRAYTRKYSPGQIKVLADYVEKMERAGKMRKSSSPISSNPLLVEKKDGTFRVCVNFIPVNKLIHPMAWPIPDVLAEINKLQGCKWLSFWDCKDGYLQSPIAEHCKYLTAVSFPNGLWEYNVLPMGLIDSMQWYTRHMADVFDTPELRNLLAAFVDDMGTGTGTCRGHIDRMRHVLERMDYVNGSFAGSKSAFFVQRREFLGRVVGPEGVSAHPKKLSKMAMWPKPTNVRELRQFVGFALFLGDFVSGFSQKAGPLFELYRFDKRPAAFVQAWNENPVYEKAFHTLQEAVLSSPVLIIINHARPVIMSADTSDYATGYVLAHAADEADDVKINRSTSYRPILFGSRKLSSPETRYFATERELLGLVYAIKKNEHLLLDKTIHAFIDHRALLYLHNLQFQNARLTRWTLYISRFKIDIHHRPGKDMRDSDPLSRVPMDGPAPNHGLEDEIELMGGLRLVAMIEIDEEPYASIAAWLQGDSMTSLTTYERQKISRQALGYFIMDGRLMKRTVGANPRMYVPPTERQEIINTLHGSETNGHLGIVGTYRWAAISYFWPGQYEDIKKTVETCDACQRFQRRDPTRYRHHRIPPPPSVFLVVGMDLIGPLPCSHGKTYILNLIDYLSGWVESIALCDIKGTTITREVRRRWFQRYGVPQCIITDNGTSLAQGSFKQECDAENIKIATAAAYHPETNGKVERYNGFLSQQLRRCLAEEMLPETEWRIMLERCVWTWNTMQKDVQGYSPFEILYGQPARNKLNNKHDAAATDKKDLKSLKRYRRALLAEVRATARDRTLKEHQERRKRDNLPAPRQYQVGQAVLVYRPNLEKQWSHKLQPRWIGPLYVAAKRAGDAYVLAHKKGFRRKLFRRGRAVNHTHLKPYRSSAIRLASWDQTRTRI